MIWGCFGWWQLLFHHVQGGDFGGLIAARHRVIPGPWQHHSSRLLCSVGQSPKIRQSFGHITLPHHQDAAEYRPIQGDIHRLFVLILHVNNSPSFLQCWWHDKKGICWPRNVLFLLLPKLISERPNVIWSNSGSIDRWKKNSKALHQLSSIVYLSMSSSALRLLIGCQEGHLVCKNPSTRWNKLGK